MELAVARNINASTPNGTMAEHGDDSALHVEFSMEAFHHDARSREEGRPIYEDRAFMTIYYPGDNTKRTARWATDQDKQRFSRQWQAFESQAAEATIGIPITEWPPITKSQAMELKHLNIHTVEQLASMPDGALSWMGARELRTQAQSWLSKAEGHAAEAKLAKQNADLVAQIEALQSQLNEVSQRTAKTEDAIKLKDIK